MKLKCTLKHFTNYAVSQKYFSEKKYTKKPSALVKLLLLVLF